MAEPEPQEYTIKGRKLECPICHRRSFWTEKAQVMLQEPPLSPRFGVVGDPANAKVYVCAFCRHIIWFVPAEGQV
jgi:hypothetical protein